MRTIERLGSARCGGPWGRQAALHLQGQKRECLKAYLPVAQEWTLALVSLPLVFHGVLHAQLLLLLPLAHISLVGVRAACSVFAGVMAAFVSAISLVPFSKGVETKDAQVGPFNPGAEAANGRLAMLALAVVLYVEHTTSGVFIDIVKEKLPF